MRIGMSMDSFLSLLQFTDGLFPAGAYAHSFGLEYYVQTGQVRDAEGVEAFVRSYLEASCAPTDAVACLCAWRCGQQGDLEGCVELDALLDAMKPASELRQASCQMGRQTLRVAAKLIDSKLLHAFFAAVERGAAAGHHAIAFGLAGSVMGWSAREVVGAFLYSASAALAGSALRLLPLGQLAGQRILWNVQPLIRKLADEVQNRNQSDMWSFAPALEAAAMRHAILDARLFRS
jgi:urease accessory protein